MTAPDFQNLDHRISAVERRLDHQEQLSLSRHEANTLRLDGLGKAVEDVAKHLTNQDDTLGKELKTISTKLAVADGAKAAQIEIASRNQTRWFLFIGAASALGALASSSNFIRHMIP